MSNTTFLTVNELSTWVNVPVSTLYLWVHLKKIPYIKVGRLLRFEKIIIEDWLAKSRVQPDNIGQHLIGGVKVVCQ